jgi:hypothetical protein
MATSKKTVSKKAATKKAATKKAVTKKAVTEKAPTKAVTKKAATKQVGTKQAVTKKATATKANTKTAAKQAGGNGVTKQATTDAPKTPKKRRAPTREAAAGLHGEALVDAAIARVRERGFALLGSVGVKPPKKPAPLSKAVLDALTFPNGKPLPPSLRRWLAFDASWLAWFDDLDQPAFEPLQLGAFAEQEFDMDWGFSTFEGKLPGDCIGLHFGSESRRLLYVGEPDSHGEYPVLVIDTDDVPYVGLEYPGFDVYIAEAAGLLQDREHETYGDLLDDAVYGGRMQEHADALFGGKVGFEELDLLEEGEEADEEDYEDLEELEDFDLSDEPDFGDDWEDDGYL